MRNASAALTTLLNSASEFFIADLVSIIPLTGSTIYLTSAATDIAIVSQVDNASHVFKAGGVDPSGTVRPTFSIGTVKTVIGTQVDSTDVTLLTDVLALVGGVPWPTQARAGFFDGARICIERAFTATWGDWTPGTLIRFWGRVTNVQPSRNTILLKVDSDLVLLSRAMPRNYYQAGCVHNVYDAGCGLNRASFTVSGATTAGSTAASLNTNLTQADHYFELGVITFTSGANSGLSRTVKSYLNSGGVVVPTATLPTAPSIGDTFTIYPGCDKLGTDASGNVNNGTCKVKFNNLAHFRGFPFVPPPESSS